MGMREKLIEILRKPIFLHEQADPTEAVADYLIDNDVVPVVRCKDCKSWYRWDAHAGECRSDKIDIHSGTLDTDFCSYGERRTDDQRKETDRRS